MIDVSEEIKAMDTPDGHQTLIRAQWLEYAAFAWRQYLKQGRGAIAVFLARATERKGGLDVPSFYIAAGSERLTKLGGWPSTDVAQLIEEYDPEQDVIFLFMRLDGEIFHYNVSDELTPPEAFRASSR